MFNKKEYDVIIVGAGPAGSVAAQFCAKKGYSTLILEKREQVGIPVRCGEATSTRDRLKTFGPLCEEAIETDIKGALLIGAGDTRIRYIKDEPIGMVTDRTIFDKWYADLAVKAGAELVLEARVFNISSVENNQRKVFVEVDGQEHELSARIVIGADGVESLSAQWVGINARHKIKTTCTGIEIKLDRVIGDPDCLTFWQGHDYINEGYLWSFPKVKSGTTNFGAGLLVSNSLTKSQTIKDITLEFLAKNFPEAKILEITGGLVPVSGNLKKYWADNFMMVGDVAHHTNPMTGGGMISGMFAGMYAAETVDDAFKANDFSEMFFEKYRDKCDVRFGFTHLKEMHIREFVLALKPQDQESFYKMTQVIVHKGKLQALFTKLPSLIKFGFMYWKF